MPMLVRGPVIGAPPTAIWPDVTASRPPSIINKVLLPQPEGPRTATNCPRGRVKLTELTASIAPAVPARKTLLTSATSTYRSRSTTGMARSFRPHPRKRRASDVPRVSPCRVS
jgi:hypothetical protein